MTSLALLFCALLVPADPGETRPRFVLHAADGSNRVGLLEKIAPDWSIRLRGGQPGLTESADVVTLRREGKPLPPMPAAEQVVLGNGDRLALPSDRPIRLVGERLECAPPLMKPGEKNLSLPLAAVALLWFAAPEGTPDPALLLRQILAESRANDVVLLRNGDRVEGTVIAIDRDSACRMEIQKKRLDLPPARIAAVAFSTELLARPRPRSAFGHLVLADGSRLSLLSAEVDVAQQRLTGKMVLGPAVDIPLREVIGLDIYQGAATYLSDLRPIAYRHTSYFGLTWTLVKDGSVSGHELRLNGNTFDKGLGMHSRTEVTYELGSAYQWFECLAGLDEREGRRGRARIGMLLDGKARELGGNQEITGRDRPLQLRIEVRGVRTLTLLVDFSRQGDVGSHVDWADARLIKTRSP